MAIEKKTNIKQPVAIIAVEKSMYTEYHCGNCNNVLLGKTEYDCCPRCKKQNIA